MLQLLRRLGQNLPQSDALPDSVMPRIERSHGQSLHPHARGLSAQFVLPGKLTVR
jgi:hypothetical protein